jgi:hypothetical protein
VSASEGPIWRRVKTSLDILRAVVVKIVCYRKQTQFFAPAFWRQGRTTVHPMESEPEMMRIIFAALLACSLEDFLRKLLAIRN